MLMALDAWQARDGHVAVSRAWRPACSFMQDTATALKQAFSRADWMLREHEDYLHDQRLVGGVGLLPPLSARLVV